MTHTRFYNMYKWKDDNPVGDGTWSINWKRPYKTVKAAEDNQRRTILLPNKKDIRVIKVEIDDEANQV